MAVITPEQTANYLRAAGVTGTNLAKLTAIAYRESRYKTDAHRTDRNKSALSGDRGLFQINYIWDDQLRRAGIINSKADLFNPAINAKAAAYVLSKQGLAAWGAASGGWTAGGNPMHGVPNSVWQRAQTAASNATGSSSQGAAKQTHTAPKVGPDPVRNNKYDPKYVPPKVDKAQQKALTSLLQEFGVDYKNAPRADPQLLTFLRGLGMSQDTAEANYNTTVHQLEDRAIDSRGDLVRASQRAQDNIRVGAESRNTLVSGATNKQFAREQEDVAAKRADIEMALSEGKTTARMGLDTLQDQYRQQATERTIDTETRQQTEEAQKKEQVQAYKRQQAETDFQYARQQQAQDKANAQRIALLNGSY